VSEVVKEFRVMFAKVMIFSLDRNSDTGGAVPSPSFIKQVAFLGFVV